MDIFGFTAVDTALAVLGLNYAQIITDFIFFKTPLASLAFACGIIACLVQIIRTGHYRALALFFLIFLSISFLLLPKRPEGTIQSALEEYSQSSQSSQDLKDQVLDYHDLPVILSFLGQAMDVFMIGIIHALDTVTPAWAQYLNAPFGLHNYCLHIREAMEQGIGDPGLRQKLNTFLYDQYLPALGMVQHDDPAVDFGQMWPGHEKITPYYPSSARKQWEGMERQLRNYLDTNPALAEQARVSVIALTQTSAQVMEQSLLKSITGRELKEAGDIHKITLLRQAGSSMMAVFPWIYGWANLMLYALFPLVILAMCISRSWKTAVYYLKGLVWVKSWSLGGALSFYASLLMARMQAQAASGDPSWAWERPYFCIYAGIVLGLVPLMTFFLIKPLTK
ncbi:MAG: hypothetical protein HY591_04800 [Candidatus Omnitrophica bacterium]|nr:hypothetical protein [Candidatus Omnitrophota bacterium]